jgi:hypothetical protein
MCASSSVPTCGVRFTASLSRASRGVSLTCGPRWTVACSLAGWQTSGASGSASSSPSPPFAPVVVGLLKISRDPRYRQLNHPPHPALVYITRAPHALIPSTRPSTTTCDRITEGASKERETKPHHRHILTTPAIYANVWSMVFTGSQGWCSGDPLRKRDHRAASIAHRSTPVTIEPSWHMDGITVALICSKESLNLFALITTMCSSIFTWGAGHGDGRSRAPARSPPRRRVHCRVWLLVIEDDVLVVDPLTNDRD